MREKERKKQSIPNKEPSVVRQIQEISTVTY